MPTTKASQKAVNKYMAVNYDRINVTVDKGQREILKAHAEKYDSGSVNAFIKRAIAEQMKRDNASVQPVQTPARPVTAQETSTPAAPATEPAQEQPQPVVSSALAHIHAQQERIWAAGEMLKLKALQNKKITYESMLTKGTLKDWQEEDYKKTLAELATYEEQ